MTDDKMTECRTLDGQPHTDARDFVPKGLNDRSQAIYCLGCIRNEARPVGYGMIGNGQVLHDLRLAGTLAHPDHTVPTGRGIALWAFQAINCLATIIQSLRDNMLSAIHLLPI